MIPAPSNGPAHAAAERRAVIDVGTNSVKVLVADVTDGAVLPVWETSEQTRLGAGFYQSRQLQPGPVAATATAVARYATEAARLGALPPRVIATSAAREAVNARDLVDAVRAASGLELEVVSGETEAEWGFRGVTTAPHLAGQRLLVLDVGGGSTEFILGVHAPEFRHSVGIGSVRLLEQHPVDDPPTGTDRHRVREAIARHIDRDIAPLLEPAFARHGRPDIAVGIGGTTAILALVRHGRSEFDRERIEATRFQPDELSRMTHTLWSMPLAARRGLPGIPPERADVILFGAALYDAIVGRFRLPCLAVSTRGLRFAALLEDRKVRP